MALGIVDTEEEGGECDWAVREGGGSVLYRHPILAIVGIDPQVTITKPPR